MGGAGGGLEEEVHLIIKQRSHTLRSRYNHRLGSKGCGLNEPRGGGAEGTVLRLRSVDGVNLQAIMLTK